MLILRIPSEPTVEKRDLDTLFSSLFVVDFHISLPVGGTLVTSGGYKE